MALLSDVWLVAENKTPVTINLSILEIQEQPCNLYGITTFLFIGIGRRLLSPREVCFSGTKAHCAFFVSLIEFKHSVLIQMQLCGRTEVERDTSFIFLCECLVAQS